MADIAKIVLGLTLLKGLLTCLHVNVQLVSEYIEEYRRLNTLRRSLLHSTLPRHRPRCQRRRFWMRPGRSSSWWDNFENEVVVAEEWRENFRMSRTALLSLSELLRPHIEGRTTIMRLPVSVVKKVACTLLFSR